MWHLKRDLLKSLHGQIWEFLLSSAHLHIRDFDSYKSAIILAIVLLLFYLFIYLLLMLSE